MLVALGVETDDPDALTTLKHVKPHAVADEIANRTACKDFERFKPLFLQVQKDLEKGVRKTRRFQTMAEIKQGEFLHCRGAEGLYRRGRQGISHRIEIGAIPACGSFLTMGPRATSCCARCSARCIAMKQGDASPTRTPGPLFEEPIGVRRGRKAALSMSCVASRTIPRSPGIGRSSTKLA